MSKIGVARELWGFISERISFVPLLPIIVQSGAAGFLSIGT